jgi:hypothetical protein
VTLLRQLETVTSENPILTRFMRSKSPKVSDDDGCKVWGMSGCKAWASRELLVEKKDDEVGLDSRLLKKDNKRFMPLGVGEGKAMRLRLRFKAQHYCTQAQARVKHSISNFIFLCRSSILHSYAREIHSHSRTACSPGGTSLGEGESCYKCHLRASKVPCE